MNKKTVFGLRPWQGLLSLKSWLVLGFLLASLPLLLGFWYSLVSMREVSALGETVHSEIFEQANMVRSVLQKTADIERKARLFVLLSDPSLRQPYERESYEKTRASFRQALSELLSLSNDNSISLLINELKKKEELIYQQVVTPDRESDLKLMIDEGFYGLREASYALSREFENHVDYKFNTLRAFSKVLEQSLLWKELGLASLSLLIVLLLGWMWSHAVRQLDLSVNRLLVGHFEPEMRMIAPFCLQRLSRRLEQLRNQLRQEEVFKSQFIGTVAQEMAIIYQDIQKVVGESEIKYEEVLGCGEKLRGIHQVLQAYSLAHSESERWAKQEVDMKVLVDSVLDARRESLQAKTIDVKTVLESLMLIGILEQLQYIVEQLLDYAAQRSPERGEIRIRLRGGDGVVLEVEDDGESIDQITQEQSLSLWLAKDFAHRHRGGVEIVGGVQGLGACIRLYLPFWDKS